MQNKDAVSQDSGFRNESKTKCFSLEAVRMLKHRSNRSSWKKKTRECGFFSTQREEGKCGNM